MNRIAALWLGASLLALPAPATAADRALVVGIDDYPGILVGGVGNLRDLRGAVNDARRMQKLMTDAFGIAPENVVLLRDGEATRQGILDALRRELVDKTGPGDRVVFYYAGHGAQVRDVSGDETEDGLDEVLVPHDATADLGVANPQLETVVLDDDIDSVVADLAGREVTVIVDACHSGTITRSALAARDRLAGVGYSPVRTLTPYGPLTLGPLSADLAARDRPAGMSYSPVRTLTPYGPLTLGPLSADLAARGRHRADARLMATPAATRGIAAGPKLAVWTAVTSAQYALEDMSVGGSAGLFTSRFVRGLRDFAADLNRNGTVTPPELLAYLREETRAYCLKFDCLGQDPLPTLEAFDGYVATALAEQAGSYVVAAAEPDAGEPVVRTGPPVSAVGTDLIPAIGPAVTVVIDGGPAGKVGGALKVTVTSPIAGRLVVLDRRDDGTTVQLFPNEPSSLMGVGDRIGAGETVHIPGDGAPFELIADTAGGGVITALVVDPSVDVDSLLAANETLAPIADPASYTTAMATAVGRAIVFAQKAETEDALEAAPAAPPIARGQAAYRISE